MSDRLTTVQATGDGALLVLPGGGYGGHADHEAEPVGEWAAELGLAAYVLRYRLGLDPIPLDDVAAALATVRESHNWVAILGFSAGGHLAASALTRLSPPLRPDAGILIYPVISMRDGMTHGGSRLNLIGDSPSPEKIEATSNEACVQPGGVPAFLFHGANDDAVPVENALAYASALSRCQVPFELHVIPDGPHGFGMGVPGTPTDWRPLAARWLLERRDQGR